MTLSRSKTNWFYIFIIYILKTSFDDDAEFSVEILALGSDPQMTLPDLRINFCFNNDK